MCESGIAGTPVIACGKAMPTELKVVMNSAVDRMKETLSMAIATQIAASAALVVAWAGATLRPVVEVSAPGDAPNRRQYFALGSGVAPSRIRKVGTPLVYLSWSNTLSRPACTQGSSTPGDPEAPTPPIISSPTLIGSPPGMAITFGSVTC